MTEFTLGDLAARIGAEVVGDAGVSISAIRTLEEAGPSDLSFYHNRRYLEAARTSGAGAILVADPTPFPDKNLIVRRNPYAALGELLELLHPARRPPAGLHPSAVVDASATVGPGASIGPNAVVSAGAVVGERAVIGPGCVVGHAAVVGEDTVLHANVTIEEGCRVGARCVVHAGTVIGSDGFGFATVDGVHRKIPQVGIVVVEDDVELGANVCIDRAALGETRIGRGTKVDNLVQVGHNVRVGEHCLLVSQVGISGSTHLGRHVVMAGQSGAVGHLSLADGTTVTAKTGVTEDTAPGAMVSGFPSRPHKEWLRALANLYGIHELKRRLKALEAEVRKDTNDD